ncbi:MAG: hypothetical protein K8R46_02135, partial [Pirellulales bacterium]|nr:hypothetical protein [Pirellulales bacterium]
VDARSDLYSLGALLYALLARRPVFRGKSLPELLHKHRLEQPEPVRKHAPDTPAELEHILGELLEKDPGRRISNADILSRRLEAMLHALSLGPETLAADPGWFFTQQSAAGSESAGTNPSVDDVPVTQELTPGGGNRGASIPPKSLPTGSAAPPAADKPPPPPVSRFVEVSEDELGQIEEDEPQPAMISWQTGALAGALLLVGLTIWWFLQPPTADSLYNRIKAETAGGSIASIVRADGDIHEFLNRYSNDPRAVELRGFEREIDLHKLERQFERRLKGLGGADNLQPIERAYLEAIRYIRLDKELGATRLRAIIDLFGRPGDDAEPTRQCLILAQRQLEKLKKETGKFVAEQLDLLNERLDAADALLTSDPGRAKEMYRAVVILYAEKPWAADAVRRARDAIEAP